MPGTGKLILGTPKGRILARAWDKASNLALGCKHGQRHTRPTPPTTNGGEVAAVGYSNNAQCCRIFVPYFSAHQMRIPRACSLVVRLRCLCKGQRSDGRSGDRAAS